MDLFMNPIIVDEADSSIIWGWCGQVGETPRHKRSQNCDGSLGKKLTFNAPSVYFSGSF